MIPSNHTYVGVKSLDFKADIMYNSNIEWHEAFSIILGPSPPVIDKAVFTILDNNVKCKIKQLFIFFSGVKQLDFKVDILYNSDIEWHEAFSVILGPTPPVGAELGTIHTAMITILDNDVSGSIVLPSPPVVCN